MYLYARSCSVSDELGIMDFAFLAFLNHGAHYYELELEIISPEWQVLQSCGVIDTRATYIRIRAFGYVVLLMEGLLFSVYCGS